MNIVELYCRVDDFCKEFMPEYEKRLLANGNKLIETDSLNMSEIITIMINFHIEGYRDFKNYYKRHVCNVLKWAFPRLVSYNRFVELEKTAMVPLVSFLYSMRGRETGIYFVDSTALEVCHIKRAKWNKTFKGLAAKSKSTMGWFYGFKLHLVCNDKGEIMNFSISKGNVDDRTPVRNLAKDLQGSLVGDRGYIDFKLFEDLMAKGLKLITKIKTNMKNKLMPLIDKILLRKRSIIETINDQLKNIYQIEHTRHRSPINFLVNLFSGLAAYSLSPKKPSLNFKINHLLVNQ